MTFRLPCLLKIGCRSEVVAVLKHDSSKIVEVDHAVQASVVNEHPLADLDTALGASLRMGKRNRREPMMDGHPSLTTVAVPSRPEIQVCHQVCSSANPKVTKIWRGHSTRPEPNLVIAAQSAKRNGGPQQHVNGTLVIEVPA